MASWLSGYTALETLQVAVFYQNVNLSVPCNCRAVFDVLVMVPTPPVAITLAGIWN
jgi:hypothetical protein